MTHKFYSPHLRAGGRLPHSWVEAREGRVSTLDLVSRGSTHASGVSRGTHRVVSCRRGTFDVGRSARPR